MKVHEEHKEHAKVNVRFGVITVSTSRYEALKKGEKIEDVSGNLAEKLLRDFGFEVVKRDLVPDDTHEIRRAVFDCFEAGCNAIILIGGTGLAPSDVTVEAIKPLFLKEIEGFGELFRFLSYKRIGSSAMLSRATAGIVEPGKVIFILPGSPDAVELAVKELIAKEVKHIIYISSG